jgi:hypothetical protein
MAYRSLNLQSSRFLVAEWFNKKNKMEKEQKNKEDLYRIEIFQLLVDSLGQLNEHEHEIIKEIFLSDKINNEELLKKIIE